MPDMLGRPVHRTAVSMRRLFASWRTDRRGVAAVEFALVAPLMAAMFVGAVEMSQAITVNRRVTQVAGSAADLVARASKTISQSEVGDIMRVGSYIMKPYSATPIRITLRNVTSSPSSATRPSKPGSARITAPAARRRAHARTPATHCRPTW
jgi:Flp pilus assembly protein TadG